MFLNDEGGATHADADEYAALQLRFDLREHPQYKGTRASPDAIII